MVIAAGKFYKYPDCRRVFNAEIFMHFLSRLGIGPRSFGGACLEQDSGIAQDGAVFQSGANRFFLLYANPAHPHYRKYTQQQ